MAVTKAERSAYNNQIKENQSLIEHAKTRLKEIEKKKREIPSISGYYALESIVEHLKIIANFINMNDSSVDMLSMKNEGYLNNARKEVYKVLQHLEDLFGADIDRSLKENDEYLVKISKVNPAQILTLVKNINELLDKLINRLGEGSKWKWSFVDIKGRMATVAKNAVSFGDIQKYRDPRMEFYKERLELLKISKELLNEAAKQFRTRYEVSTNVPADLLKSIEFLSILRKIIVLMGDSGEAAKLKNTIDALRERLESDEKKKDLNKQDKIKKN